jgi:hypothetical protein
VYNGHENPAYNADSYTWDRWEIKKHDIMPEVKAIKIEIAGGENIPRVEPSRFNAQQFQNMTNDTITLHLQDPKRKSVEFLWRDIACIN